MSEKTAQKRTKTVRKTRRNIPTPDSYEELLQRNPGTVLPINDALGKAVTNKFIVKAKRGRPTKYRPIFCDWIIQYFEQMETLVMVVDDPGGKGGTQTRFETVRIPGIIGFAGRLGVETGTLYDWAEQHREFKQALARAQAMEKAIIFELGMAGRLGKGLAELYFTNHLGFKDTRHMDITSDDKPIVPITALQLNVNTPQKQIDQ